MKLNQHQWWRVLLLITSCLFVSLFIITSNGLVNRLAKEEHNKMEIWAAATHELASSKELENMDLVLKILQSNHSIPVIIEAESGEIVQHLNIKLPTNSVKQEEELERRLEQFKQINPPITIELSDNIQQQLYYGNSSLLTQLSYFPYIQLLVLILYLALAYLSFQSSKRAEQNLVWVGLSKETAHQLGTPISSLMAWIELLELQGVEPEMLTDMKRDVQKLVVIADRFSKIGSQPSLELHPLGELLERTTSYLKARVSGKVKMTLLLPSKEILLPLSPPLFEWVIENLCKNAVDAMEGSGSIEIALKQEGDWVYIEVKDSGKGIAKRNRKKIFQAGFTTKTRGWGLGLTLAKRIVEEYHHGKIEVKESEINRGTTFRIALNTKAKY